MTIVTEELLLLAYDDHSGRGKVQHLDLVLAGGLLLDLVLAERVDMDGRHLVVTRPQPVGHPLLDETLQRLATSRTRTPKAWVNKLRRGARTRVAQGLADQGVLRHELDRIAGLIPWQRYLPLNPQPKADARARLENLLEHDDAEARTAALAGLVYAGNMERRALPMHSRRQVRKRFKAIAKESPVAKATGKAIEATQAAVSAAIVASVAASSSGGGGGGS